MIEVELDKNRIFIVVGFILTNLTIFTSLYLLSDQIQKGNKEQIELLEEIDISIKQSYYNTKQDTTWKR